MGTTRKKKTKIQSWRDAAACKKPLEGYTRDEWVNLFFSNGDRQYRYAEAKLICAQCPVQLECLQFALETGEKAYGIYGGYTPIERRVVSKAIGQRKRRENVD